MDDDIEQIALYALIAFGAVAVIQTIRARAAYPQGQSPVNLPGTEPQASIPRKLLHILAPMQISADGIQFIKNHEGLTLNRSSDVGKAVIGWGHDYIANDPILLAVTGTSNPASITQTEADEILNMDAANVSKAVNAVLKVEVTQDQFDALGDFAYNIGITAFQNSTLIKMLNNGNFSGASAQFGQWVNSQGQYNQGLANRRADEQSLFNGGVQTS